MGVGSHEGQRYFDGEVEPCINGRTIETGATSGSESRRSWSASSGERLADGGWNCEAERGSVRSSFDSTINVLDGLLESSGPLAGPPRSASAPQWGVSVERELFPPQEHRRGGQPGVLDFASRTTGTTTVLGA